MCGKFDRHSVKISVYCYFSTAFYSDQQIFDLRFPILWQHIIQIPVVKQEMT